MGEDRYNIAEYDNVCLFAHFDHDNIVDEYVFCYLQEINRVGYKIVFITTCSSLKQYDIDQLGETCIDIIVRDNNGWDFSGWAEVINGHLELFDASNLLLANDSVYGPIGSLRDFIQRMSSSSYDFWGATISYQIKPHLQSYFINFGSKILKSKVFHSFWADIKQQPDKNETILKYEIGLTETLKSAGFVYGSSFGAANRYQCIEGINLLNPSHHLFDIMLQQHGCPFLKVELVRNNPFGVNISGLQDIVTSAGYDANLIKIHQSRIGKYYKSHSCDQIITNKLLKIAKTVRQSMHDEDRAVTSSIGTFSLNYRKLKIIAHAMMMLFVRPVYTCKMLKSAFALSLGSIKHGVVLSFNNFKTKDAVDHVYTLYDYRRQRGYNTKLRDPPDTDCYSLRSYVPRHRVAVVCHLFYVDACEELLNAVKRLPPCDVFISLVKGHSDHLKEEIEHEIPTAKVITFANHGRDIFPFIKILSTGVLFRYEALLKLHSKKSCAPSRHPLQGATGSWRTDLLSALVPQGHEEEFIEKFISGKEFGIATHPGYIFDNEHMGSNAHLLNMLCNTNGARFNATNLEFVAGTMFWIKPWLLREIDALNLVTADFDPEPIPDDGMLIHALERHISVIVNKAGFKLKGTNEVLQHTTQEVNSDHNVDIVAYYLPQFHPIPENDAWWGEGFTEWRNVASARPVFETHYQPRCTGALGYYDLRMDGVMNQQAELATNYGIKAFAFYYYWFSGKTLLDMPIKKFMQDDDIEMNFMLCWANENWTRNWDGLCRDVLLHQQYDENWVQKYAEDIAPYLLSPKYYRREDKPVLIIYNVSAIPNCRSATTSLREYLKQNGVGEIDLIALLFYGVDKCAGYYGVDGFAEFPPHRIGTMGMDKRYIHGLHDEFNGHIFSYEDIVDIKLKSLSVTEPEIELGVMCAWDNTARRQYSSDVFHGATPSIFRRWLHSAYYQSNRRSLDKGRSLLFINAWNEWAEGSYLEPDLKYGNAYLEAIKSVVGSQIIRD